MALASCAHNSDRAPGQSRLADNGGGQSFLGLGKKKKASATDGAAVIGVNSFLWRATLETLSFMPLASADPNGGVVTTEWYANPEAPRERFKATVYILDTRLRADGLKVALNRQILAANGWSDAPSDPEVAIQLENQILVRARELRLSTQG
ncbi:MAG: DUF3576 domain-containing protein [Alphaproteobacteria bacterium]